MFRIAVSYSFVLIVLIQLLSLEDIFWSSWAIHGLALLEGLFRYRASGAYPEVTLISLGFAAVSSSGWPILFLLGCNGAGLSVPLTNAAYIPSPVRFTHWQRFQNPQLHTTKPHPLRHAINLSSAARTLLLSDETILQLTICSFWLILSWYIKFKGEAFLYSYALLFSLAAWCYAYCYTN